MKTESQGLFTRPDIPSLPLADMHCHILPGVDDGSTSMDESIAMLRAEYLDGVRTVFFTPHYRAGMFETSRNECREKFQELRKKSLAIFPDLELYLGCEFHVSMDMQVQIAEESSYRMAEGNYVLTEFSSSDEKFSMRNYIQRLTMNGFHPVIAHVERYPACRDLRFLMELKNMGALIQVNADAILGMDGFGFRSYTRRLLREGLVDMIGSDCHDMKNRAPHLGRCAKFLCAKYDAKLARILMWESPRRMLSFR